MNEQDWKKRKRREPFARLNDREIFRLARHKMEVERRYLDPCLTMESMANELNVHRNALSAAVNRCAKMSFTLWLTSYRTTEVERLATAGENRTVSLENLALRAGFPNRNSFYRGFKSMRGTTPAEWRKMKTEYEKSTNNKTDEKESI